MKRVFEYIVQEDDIVYEFEYERMLLQVDVLSPEFAHLFTPPAPPRPTHLRSTIARRENTTHLLVFQQNNETS